MFQATLDREYRLALDIAAETKRQAAELRDATAAGPVSFNAIEQFHRALIGRLSEWARIKAIPGIAEYAQAQTGDDTYDIAVEFGAMETEAAATRDWIEANIPQDVDGWWLVRRWTPGSGVETRTFTSASTAPFRTRLNALIGTIN